MRYSVLVLMPIKSTGSTLAGFWSSRKDPTSAAVVECNLIWMLVEYSLCRPQHKFLESLVRQAQNLRLIGQQGAQVFGVWRVSQFGLSREVSSTMHSLGSGYQMPLSCAFVYRHETAKIANDVKCCSGFHRSPEE
jgi:hypothetical protein